MGIDEPGKDIGQPVKIPSSGKWMNIHDASVPDQDFGRDEPAPLPVGE
jgi:hypothetical protein